MKASFFKSLVVIGVSVVSMWSANVNAASIGLQFTDNGTTASSPSVLQPTDVAGVVAQSSWNVNLQSGSFNGSSLLDSTGATTGVAYTATGGKYGNGLGNFPVSDPNKAGNDKVMSGQLGSFFGGSATVNFTGITYSQYDVYVYLRNDANGRAGTITDGTTPINYTTDINGSSFVLVPGAGGNYAVFTGKTGSSLTLTLTVPTNGGLNAIQLVDTSVPEPASIGLIGIGLLPLLGRRSRQV